MLKAHGTIRFQFLQKSQKKFHACVPLKRLCEENKNTYMEEVRRYFERAFFAEDVLYLYVRQNLCANSIYLLHMCTVKVALRPHTTRTVHQRNVTLARVTLSTRSEKYSQRRRTREGSGSKFCRELKEAGGFVRSLERELLGSGISNKKIIPRKTA